MNPFVKYYFHTRDTIYRDTLFIEKGSDTLSQNDILNQVGTMHTMYSDNFNILLILFTGAVAVIGFLIPWILKLYQKHQLKEDIKEAVIAEFDRKIEEKTKSLSTIIDMEISTLKSKQERINNDFEFTFFVHKNDLFLTDNEIYHAILNTLSLVIFAIRHDLMDRSIQITIQLGKIKDILNKNQTNIINTDDNILIESYFETMDMLSNNNDSLRKYADYDKKEVREIIIIIDINNKTIIDKTKDDLNL